MRTRRAHRGRWRTMRVDGEAAVPLEREVRRFRARGAGGAGPDGGRHQCAVPRDVPLVRSWADLRERNGDGQRGGASQRKDRADDDLRPGRDAAQPADLRQRPGHLGRGDHDAVRRGPSRSHRHELRLPCGKSHPQGRGRSRAREAQSAAGHLARRSARRGAVRRADHRQVPQRHRRRSAHLPADRTHRSRRRGGGNRVARPHRAAALRRPRRLGLDRRAQGGGAGDPGARQRRHLGGVRRRGDDAGHGL
jgi:hypothetical protein